MYEDKYIELAKLKRKCIIGGLLAFIEFLVVFTVLPILMSLIVGFGDTMDANPKITIAILIIMAIVMAITIKYLCIPYFKYKSSLKAEVKINMLKNEMNNAFNSSFRIEDINSFNTELNVLNVYNSIRNISDCFSIKYQNVRVKYADLNISTKNSDGDKRIIFNGQVLVFNLNNSIDSNLYVTKRDSGLFGTSYMIDKFIYSINNKEVIPTNNILKEDLAFKSNGNPTIIEDPSFQELMNNLVDDKDYSIIFSEDKLYVFKRSYLNNFEVDVKNQQLELDYQEKMRNEINMLKTELDKILNYKDKLNIKEDTF